MQTYRWQVNIHQIHASGKQQQAEQAASVLMLYFTIFNRDQIETVGGLGGG